MGSEPDSSAAPPASAMRAALRTVAHDLGNLASRLTLLSANLQAQIPDEGRRSEAVSLLEDTAMKIRQAIGKLREVERDV
ncbi:MAG TPA: hypothetical protein VGK94_03440 [Candidatus Polarisedimenticolia bacterium]